MKPLVQLKANQLIAKCKELGINLIITSGFRSIEEQNALYAQGRTKSGNIVTNAKGGQSLHNYGVAFDVVEIKNGKANWNCDWNTIGKIGMSLGLEWGDRGYVDLPHFQYRAGYSLYDFQNGKINEEKFSERQYLLATISYLKGVLAKLKAKLKKT